MAAAGGGGEGGGTLAQAAAESKGRALARSPVPSEDQLFDFNVDKYRLPVLFSPSAPQKLC